MGLPKQDEFGKMRLSHLERLVRLEEQKIGIKEPSKVKIGHLAGDYAHTDFYQTGHTITFDLDYIKQENKSLSHVVQHEVKHIKEGDGLPSAYDKIPIIRDIRNWYHEVRAEFYAWRTKP